MSTGCKSSYSGLLDVSRRRHLIKGNNKCRTVFKENLTETNLTALNVSTILPTSRLRLVSTSYLSLSDHFLIFTKLSADPRPCHLTTIISFCPLHSIFSHLISSPINQRLVALSLSLTTNTSADNSWSDFQSNHTWSLVNVKLRTNKYMSKTEWVIWQCDISLHLW